MRQASTAYTALSVEAFNSAMPSPSPTSSSSETSAARLANIKGHIMDGGNPTVFSSDKVPQAPEDPLFGLMAAYRKDDFEKKVDLGIGAYRDNNAKPWVLPVVKKVITAVMRPLSLRPRLLCGFCLRAWTDKLVGR